MGSVLACNIRCLSGVCSVYVRLFNVLYVRRGEQMEWLRCEDSSNFFQTPKSVQCCQTWKLKNLIKLILLNKLLNNLQSISYNPPPPPPLPPHSGAGEGEREGGRGRAAGRRVKKKNKQQKR